MEAVRGDDVLLRRRRLEPRDRRRGLAGHGRARAHRAAWRSARRMGASSSRSRPARSGTPFVARCVAEGLAGIECLSGIPGSIGATPIQNVGAYGQEVGRDDRLRARARPRDGRGRASSRRPTCGFAYRSSAFKRDPGRWVVLAVTFALERARAVGPAALRRAGAHARRRGRARARRSPRCARRCSRCAAARGWCSTRPTPTRSAPARSSPTRSSSADGVRGARAAARSARRASRSPTGASRRRRRG